MEERLSYWRNRGGITAGILRVQLRFNASRAAIEAARISMAAVPRDRRGPTMVTHCWTD